MDQQLPFPYTFKDLTDEEKKIAEGNTLTTLRINGSRLCCNGRLKKLATEFYNFKPRPDDIWLIGFIRSGTTLTQEILYLLGTDLNYEKAAAEIMDVRFPVLHSAVYRNEEDADSYKNCPIKDKLIKSPHELLEGMKGRRFIKSHFGLNLLHPDILKIGCKVVFIARNIKDVMVSVSRYPSMIHDPDFDFTKMWTLFKHDLVTGGNYFEMLEDAWKSRHNKNVLVLFYEQVNADKKAALLKIAGFLGKSLTDDELQTLVKHLKIENFKMNKSVNNDHLVDLGLYGKNETYSFIRKGSCGGWKDVIPPELVPEIDEWIIKNLTAIPEFEIPDFWIDSMDLDIPKRK